MGRSLGANWYSEAVKLALCPRSSLFDAAQALVPKLRRVASLGLERISLAVARANSYSPQVARRSKLQRSLDAQIFETSHRGIGGGRPSHANVRRRKLAQR